MEEELQRSKSGAGIQVFREVTWPGMEALGAGRKAMDFEHSLE